jgi:G3E family GTPase
MGERTIANIIGGFLGVGKTTVVNHLLSQRPSGETWAVVVNEFGEIGIDGALVTGDERSFDTTTVREIPGGCICCTAGFAFQEAVVRMLRSGRPDRLLIEPTGIATLRSIIDTLRQPGLAQVVELRTVVTLVDPAHWASTRHRTNETYRDQIEAADVLLANRGDLSELSLTEKFLREAGALFPPKRHVAVVDHGTVDAAILDTVRDRGADGMGPLRSAAADTPVFQLTPIQPTSPLTHHRGSLHLADSGMQTLGRTFPPENIFDERCLADWVTWARRSPHLLRLKGVFHTTGGWIAYNATPQEQSVRVASHRRDSRVECVMGPAEMSGSGDTTIARGAPSTSDARTTSDARNKPDARTTPDARTKPEPPAVPSQSRAATPPEAPPAASTTAAPRGASDGATASREEILAELERCVRGATR